MKKSEMNSIVVLDLDTEIEARLHGAAVYTVQLARRVAMGKEKVDQLGDKRLRALKDALKEYDQISESAPPVVQTAWQARLYLALWIVFFISFCILMYLLYTKDDDFSPSTDVPLVIVALGTNVLLPIIAVRMPFLGEEWSVRLCQGLLWFWCVLQLGMLTWLSLGSYGKANAAGEIYFDVEHTFLVYFSYTTIVANAFFFVGLTHAFAPSKKHDATN